jgi:hypothetical protein
MEHRVPDNRNPHGYTVRRTRVENVLHVPKLDIRLLSMGMLLRSGLNMSGTENALTFSSKSQVVYYCEVSQPGSTIYQLHTRILHGASKILMELETIYTVDYDTVHRRFGHPSQEALRHMPRHTEGFPSGISIPKTPAQPCKGCAQGKLPSKSFPASDTRADRPFEKIHSDLKSFLKKSYLGYNYFMSFMHDHTSHAWITPLKAKSDAHSALNHFIAYVKNQFSTTIKR